MPQGSNRRPWYRKKRFIIPALIALVNIAANVAAAIRSKAKRRRA
jgi:hypothetical protein